ncbi:MAG: DegT/DnrJ/EryC1/StrS family aminotransferase [Bryobacteraceae bacterium]|jgi:perosamine synthetase
MRIPLSSPDVTEADIDAVVSVLRTPRLSIGPKMAQFEESIAELVRVPHAVAVSSGTAGLHLCLRALGIGEGDEVILPSFTFISPANAILYERAKPVFVDIDPLSLNLDPAKLAESITPRTRAIIVVHTFGYPADLDAILQIARRHGVPVIEDACEAIGAEYRGRAVGGMGALGVFGFYPNKPITTGEGGMVVTRDSVLAEKIRALRNQGREASDDWTEHRLLGYNYRLSEINCALGLSQMKRLGAILERREAVAMGYAKELRTNPDVSPPPVSIPDGRLCWFVYVVRLSARFTQPARDAIWRQLNSHGIGCGRYFAPLHQQPLFAPFVNRGNDLSVTEQVAARTLALPFFNTLTEEQIIEVCGALRETIGNVA